MKRALVRKFGGDRDASWSEDEVLEAERLTNPAKYRNQVNQHEKVLRLYDLTYEKLISRIKGGKFRKIVVCTGPGIFGKP
jgi:hypothetical protein